MTDSLEKLRAAVREPETRYELLGVAGSGGMGTVYVARDPELQRRVALKVLDLPDRALAERLRREAQILAGLSHPGIVPVHEVGACADGRPYYTMKLVEGARLDRWEASPAEKLRAFLRIAEAVAYAHARGVVHRDLKPQNVMIGRYGEVLVLDWGLAQTAAEATGAAVGTPGFMAPEQARGEPADARSDVHSLGAILASLVQPAPRPLAAIAARAMAHDPADRYPDAASLAADVVRHLDGAPVSAYREGALEKAARLARRHRAALVVLAAYAAGRALIFLFTSR